MSGSSLLRMLQALCAAAALVVSPARGSTRALPGWEDGAPSTRASAGGGPSTSASASELAAPLQPDRRWRLPGKEGAGGAQRRAAPRAPTGGGRKTDGQLASVSDPLGKTEAYTYNASRDLIGFTDRKNRTTTFAYDQLGRPASTQDPALRRGTFAYPVPVSGNWTGAAVFAGSPDATPAPTSLTASLRDGEYQIGLREHRAGGNPAQIEFYRDATFELSFGRSFDSFGRLRRREDRVGLPFASGSVFGTPTFFDHDLNYELNSPLPILSSYTTSRPGGFMDSTFTNNFEFDTTASQGLFGLQPYTQESYTRDAAGRITGITTTFRVSSSIYTHQALSVVYHPANKRQVQQITSGSGIQDFTYDTRGLVATRTVTIPRPRVVSVGGTPVVIDEPYLLGTFTYQYDEVGRNTVLTFPSGHTRTQVWDDLGRLTSRCYDYANTVNYPGAGPARCYSAQYDDVGNPTSLTDPERSCTIGYDNLDRVTSVSCSDGHTESYDYNALGGLSVNAGALVDHQRPRLSGGGNASAGLPATLGGQAVTLDAVGRVASLNGATLSWNRLGHLETLGAYDSFLRRAYDALTGGMFLYEGPNIAGVASGDYTKVDRRFGYDDVDHPLWMFDRENDRIIWYELDVIGNVRRLRNGPTPLGPFGGGPFDMGGYKYTAFGKQLPPDAGTPAPSSQFEQPLRWQGRWYSDIAGGLYDFRNRVWSPELGAFLSPDDFGYLTQSGTLWSWPGQNPIAIRDPFGTGESRADSIFNWLSSGNFGFGFAMYARGMEQRRQGLLDLAATGGESISDVQCGSQKIAAGMEALSTEATVAVGVAGAAPSVVRSLPKLRINLLVPKGTPTAMHGHHILPSEFVETWRKLGINHNEFIVRVPEGVHLGQLHGTAGIQGLGSGGLWNATWRTYFAEEAAAGRALSQAGVFDKVAQMLEDFGVPYYTPLP